MKKYSNGNPPKFYKFGDLHLHPFVKKFSLRVILVYHEGLVQQKTVKKLIEH